MHRWFGRLVIALAIAHGSTQLYDLNRSAKRTHEDPFKAFGNTLQEERFILFGFVAFLSVLCILMTTFSAFRHAFYETFLHIHNALVVLILASLWIHLANQPAQTLVKVIIAIWAVERLIRLSSLLYRNVGSRSTRATVEILPGEAMRVTLRLARPWKVTPGQHIFLTLPTIGLWTSHPFSIAWSETCNGNNSNTDRSFLDLSNDTEKGLPALPPSTSTSSTDKTTISLLIRPRAGLTRHLYHRALKTGGSTTSSSSSSPFTLPALTSGPYTSSIQLSSLSSHGTICLIAGGVGITAFLPLLPHLINGYTTHTTATRRICLVWVVRHVEQMEWIRGWITEILGMQGRREVLRVKLFVTQPGKNGEEGMRGPSKRVEMQAGRPDVGRLMEREVQDAVGAVGVGCCGPGGMGDEVRGAVRREVGKGRAVEYVEEGFGW